MRTRRRGTAAALALTLLLAGAVGCTATPAPAPAPEAAVSPLQTAVVDAFTEQAAELGVEGAFLLVRTPEGEFTAATGTTERGAETVPTADTVFRIGSNTKTLTGTVILQLVDEGVIRLDDPVSRYRADVPNGDQITIAMLLSMRSGLFNYTNDEAMAEAMIADLERVWQPEELLEVSFRNAPLFQPGTEYAYSNTNTVLLALIAEQVTGQSYESLIADRLIVPLGLTHTAVPLADDAGLEAPYSHGYTFFDEAEGVAGTLTQADAQDVTFMNPSWASAAGAGVSTATELADWVEALTAGEFLSEQLQAQRLASIAPMPGAPDAENWGYGLGIAKLHGLYGHNGQIPGYNSYMGADPERGLTVVIWANVAPNADGKGPADQLAGTVVPLLLAD